VSAMFRQRAVIVAMRAVTAMNVPRNDVVDVSGVWDDVMSATDAVHVVGRMSGAGMPSRAIVWIALRDGDLVLVDVFTVNVMQMRIVHVVDMVVVPDAQMAAVVAVPVFVQIVNVMLHDVERIPYDGKGQLAAALRAAALQAAQVPNSVKSWPVVLNPRGGLASTVAQPSNS